MRLALRSTRSAARALSVGATVSVLLAACVGLKIDGVPVMCGQRLAQDECLARAETGLLSLPAEHPAVVGLEVTCDATICDDDKGAGRVIVQYADGTQEVVDIAFGRTNSTLPEGATSG